MSIVDKRGSDLIKSKVKDIEVVKIKENGDQGSKSVKQTKPLKPHKTKASLLYEHKLNLT